MAVPTTAAPAWPGVPKNPVSICQGIYHDYSLGQFPAGNFPVTALKGPHAEVLKASINLALAVAVECGPDAERENHHLAKMSLYIT